MSIDARLKKSVGAFTLDLKIKADLGITVLFGASGSGKTLTLNCIAGFNRADEGRILINDKIYFDAATHVDVPPQVRRCGYLFQDHALFPHMTVRENISFAIRGRTLEKRRKLAELVEALDLGDVADRKPMQMSGGQKQRAALARTLASDPQVLLLDEPTRGLDVQLRQGFYQLLRALSMPVLLVTHDLDECLELGQQVCLLHSGRVLQTAGKGELLKKPASAEAARLLGAFSLVPAEIRALDPVRNTSKLRVGDGELDGVYYPGHLIGDHGLACILESEISIGSPSNARTGMRTAVKAATAHARGVSLQFENGLSAVVSGSKWEELREYDQLQIQVPANAIAFLNPDSVSKR